jgi:transcriptional regulator
MKHELSLKQIFDDFANKTIMNDDEIKVLTMYIKGDSIVKIADITAQSTSSVSRIIAELKEKYKNYKKVEIAKLKVFDNK